MVWKKERTKGLQCERTERIIPDQRKDPEETSGWVEVKWKLVVGRITELTSRRKEEGSEINDKYTTVEGLNREVGSKERLGDFNVYLYKFL